MAYLENRFPLYDSSNWATENYLKEKCNGSETIPQSYSEIWDDNERIIGKYFGRNAYKKTFRGDNLNATSSGWTKLHFIENVNELIYAYLVTSDKTSQQMTVHPSNSVMICLLEGYVSVWKSSGTASNNLPYSITAYYTKTID